jgi:hypothetical protein
MSADYKSISTFAGTGEAGFSGDDGPADKAQLNNPRDLEIGPDGRLYVADEYNHRVRAIDLETGTITTIAGTARPSSPATTAPPPAPPSTARPASSSTTPASSTSPTATTTASAPSPCGEDTRHAHPRPHPWFYAARPGPHLPACDTGDGDDGDELPPIIACDPAPGRICTLAGTGEAGLGDELLDPRQTDLYLPQDFTVGPDKLGYIVDWNNHRIRRINADGTTESVVGTGELGDAQDGEGAYSNLNHPTHMSVAPNGKFIIAAWHNSKMMEFDPATSVLTTICGNGMRSFGGDGGPAKDALLDLPTSTAFDADGNMYITDQANQRIRVVGIDGVINTHVGNGTAGYSGDDGPAKSTPRLNSPAASPPRPPAASPSTRTATSTSPTPPTTSSARSTSTA